MPIRLFLLSLFTTLSPLVSLHGAAHYFTPSLDDCLLDGGNPSLQWVETTDSGNHIKKEVSYKTTLQFLEKRITHPYLAKNILDEYPLLHTLLTQLQDPSTHPTFHIHNSLLQQFDPLDKYLLKIYNREKIPQKPFETHNTYTAPFYAIPAQLINIGFCYTLYHSLEDIQAAGCFQYMLPLSVVSFMFSSRFNQKEKNRTMRVILPSFNYLLYRLTCYFQDPQSAAQIKANLKHTPSRRDICQIFLGCMHPFLMARAFLNLKRGRKVFSDLWDNPTYFYEPSFQAYLTLKFLDVAFDSYDSLSTTSPLPLKIQPALTAIQQELNTLKKHQGLRSAITLLRAGQLHTIFSDPPNAFLPDRALHIIASYICALPRNSNQHLRTLTHQNDIHYPLEIPPKPFLWKAYVKLFSFAFLVIYTIHWWLTRHPNDPLHPATYPQCYIG